MPKLYNILGWIVYFWANEGTPTECIHVHVGRKAAKNATKIWILKDGTTMVANNNSNVPAKDLKRIQSIIEDNSDDIVERWEKFFGEKPVFRA